MNELCFLCRYQPPSQFPVGSYFCGHRLPKYTWDIMEATLAVAEAARIWRYNPSRIWKVAPQIPPIDKISKTPYYDLYQSHYSKR